MNIKKCFVWSTIGMMFFITGCDVLSQALNLQKPTAKLTGLKFGDVKMNSADLLFDVEVNNPYSVALPLMNMDYDLATGAEPFLNGSADLQTTIPAKSKKTISLPATINYLDMFKASKGISPGAKIPYKANLGLSVDAPALGIIRLPLKKEGQVVLPKASDIDAQGIWNVIKPK